MHEQHHFIATWDSDTGWFINIDLMNTVLLTGNVHVFADPVETDEEADEMLAMWDEAGIREHLADRTDKLLDELDTALEDMNYRPVTLEDLGGD